jgi:hypothetical protein
MVRCGSWPLGKELLRRGVFVTVLAGAFLTVPSNASAEVVGLCGLRDPGGQVRTAKLALDEDTTEEEVVISSSSEPKLVLRFKVDVCNVGPKVAQRIRVLPDNRSQGRSVR